MNSTQRHVILPNSPAAEIFLETGKIRHFNPFLLRPCTVAQAARECGISKGRMVYWVELFLEHGLLVQVEAGQGRRGASYQAVATHFVVAGLDGLLMEDFTRQQYASIWEVFLQGLMSVSRKQADEWNLHTFVTTDETVARQFVPSWQENFTVGAASGDVANVWAVLPLRRQDVKALKAELTQLMEKYVAIAAEKHSEEEVLHLVHLGLVPYETD